jgi:hypothetical protein
MTDSPRCKNCDVVIVGRFCHQCGQRDYQPKIAIWSLLRDGLEELFEVDGRMLRTVPSLLFRPGQLISAYLAGRRQSFSSPVRIYLFALLIGFFSFSYAGNRGFESYASFLESQPVQVDGGKLVFVLAKRSSEEGSQDTTVQIDVSSKTGKADGLAVAQLKKLEGMNQRQAAKILLGGFFDQAPTVVNLLIPVLGLLLKLLFRKRLYVEHLLFSLNLHSLGLLFFGISAAVGRPWIWLFALVAMLTHLFVGMHYLYGEPKRWVGLKGLALVLGYLCLLIGSFVISVLLAVMNI